MKSQNDNLRKLRVISQMIDLNNFYSVSMGVMGITLQGQFDSRIVRVAYKLKFQPSNEVNNSGYMKLRRSNIEIVLT